MDHVVYLDAAARELENLLSGTKSMIIRGAAGRKIPYGRVAQGDVLYLINNNAEGLVKACCTVKRVIHSDVLTPDASREMIEAHQDALQLTEKQQVRWRGKRYLVLIEVAGVQPLDPFPIDKSRFGNMDDWLPVGSINDVRL